jgi:hypothetical protein
MYQSSYSEAVDDVLREKDAYDGPDHRGDKPYPLASVEAKPPHLTAPVAG